MNGSLCCSGLLIEADTAHFHHHSKGGQHETDDEGEAEDDELQQHRQWSARHGSAATPARRTPDASTLTIWPNVIFLYHGVSSRGAGFMVGDRPEGSIKGFAALLGPEPKGFVGPLAMRCGGALSSPKGLAGLREPAAGTQECVRAVQPI